MLAPVTEVQFGEAALTALLLEGAAALAGFATHSRTPPDSTSATTSRARSPSPLDASDRAALDDLLAYQHTSGCAARRRSASDCRALVPALSPAVRGGIEVPGDHQVDNRALLGALVAACHGAGVDIVDSAVTGVEPGPVGDAGRRFLRARRRLRPAGGRYRHHRPGRTGLRRPARRSARSRATSCGWAPRRPDPLLPPAPCAASCTVDPSIWCPARTARWWWGPPWRSGGTTPPCRPEPCTSCSTTPGPWCPGIDELELLEARAGPAPGHARQHAVHRVDRPARGGRGQRPLPQRHPAGPLHRGGRHGPARPVNQRQDRRPGPSSAHASTGTGCPWRPGSTIADVVTGGGRRGDPKGIAVAVDRCVIPRSEWAAPGPEPGARSRWSRRRPVAE